MCFLTTRMCSLTRFSPRSYKPFARCPTSFSRSSKRADLLSVFFKIIFFLKLMGDVVVHDMVFDMGEVLSRCLGPSTVTVSIQIAFNTNKPSSSKHPPRVCFPTFSHLLIVNKLLSLCLSLRSSLSVSLSALTHSCLLVQPCSDPYHVTMTLTRHPGGGGEDFFHNQQVTEGFLLTL
jgi:hypothetical protein